MAEVKIVTLANLHPRVKSGAAVEWLKREGDALRIGEPLYVADTCKGAEEVLSEFEGTIERLLVESGSAVAAGQEIALIQTAARVKGSGSRRRAR